jgi:predicted phosphoribosyltransferase
MTGKMKRGNLIEEPRLRNKTFVFEDRTHAGTLLAEKLTEYMGTAAVILAIPAGGVPVAAVPTASMSAVQMIRTEADTVVCLNIREGRTFAVADAYKKWYDLGNTAVVAILKEAGYYK